MKKRIALVTVLLVLVALLVSCGNPKTLDGTQWEYSVLKTGTGWKFTATDATYYAVVLGLEGDATGTFEYTYDGEKVTIFDTYWDGETYTYASGTVDGNKMTLKDSLGITVTYKKK